MPNSSLDFTKVEALRKHMLLTTTHMAKVLGVSRITYSGWVKGKAIRKANEARVRSKLKELFAVLADQSWPQPEVIAMPSEQRFNMLLELMDKDA